MQTLTGKFYQNIYSEMSLNSRIEPEGMKGLHAANGWDGAHGVYRGVQQSSDLSIS